jgi:hypothetical protein
MAFCAIVLCILAVGTRASAQPISPSPPGYKEYIAILGTPVGSLPPLTTYTLAGLAQRSPEVVMRYGFVSDMALPLAPDSGGHVAHSVGTFGLTGILPVGLGGTVSLTVGVANEECDGCSGSRFIGSIDGDYRIWSTAIDNANATRFTVAANYGIGGGNPATGTSWTGNIGFPLSFRIGPDSGLQFLPFVTPGVAFVTTTGTSEASAVHSLRALTGGGVSLFNRRSNFSASAGIQYIFVPKTQVLIGIGFSYGGR